MRGTSSVKDQSRQQSVAIKKLRQPFASRELAQNIFQEIRLLKHLKHENITNLVDIFVSPSKDIGPPKLPINARSYLVTEPMRINLEALLNSKPLEGEFVQYFLYQIMRGLKYIHSAGVIHRDLKPANILVNENGDLKICDSGLTRVQKPWVTGYVSTKCYTAPEVMLTWQRYDEGVDIWSAGCIFSELLQGKPLFLGQNCMHQFHVITELLGTPSEDVISKTVSENALNFVQSLPKSQGKPLSDVMSGIDPSGMKICLYLTRNSEVTASEALAFPYLALYHDPTDEPKAKMRFDWGLDDTDRSIDAWEAKIHAEIMDYHEAAKLQESVQQWLRDMRDEYC
ncbi:hypothetical protein N7490_006787 [Penicillium lividum]|nr:hypothetical protein N7490_006787 [Penicillium lividum]